MCLALLLPANTMARKQQAWEFELNKEESSIKFEATLNDAASKGGFNDFDAKILFHPKALNRSKVSVDVDMSNINSAYQEVAENLVKKEWFNANFFPTARFEAENFSKNDEDKYIADGYLTIKGKRHPVKLEFDLLEFDDNAAHMVGTATVQRMDYGIGEGEWANTSFLKDEVTVIVEVKANRKAQ